MPPGRIRIGTCSWAEKSLIESGTFYPPGVNSPEQRLKYYGTNFDTVEVESSFYAIPTSRMVTAWIERTPPGFLFHLKALGAFTGHAIDPRTLAPELLELVPGPDRESREIEASDPKLLKALARCFVEACLPLRAVRRLGFIVFQFPPWFGCKKGNLEYLLLCKELMDGIPVAVEFRHRSWLTRQHAEKTLGFLREHRITYITCDEPQYGSLATAPFLPNATTSVAYLRLHGRNAENWLNHSTPRYDYLYPQKELATLARVATQLSHKTRTVFIMFNNCHLGHSAQNALQLQNLVATSLHQH